MAENWQITCFAREEDDDCEIVVEGETIGPPGSFFQVVVDGGAPRESDSFEEFRESFSVETQGAHTIVVRGYRDRTSAASTDLQWIHPETGVVFEGLIGSFTTHEIVRSCSTTCGLPPPGPHYISGDCDQSGAVDLSDVLFGLGFLFSIGGPQPSCESACELNGDGAIDVSDFVFTLLFLFSDGLPPAGWTDANGNVQLDDCQPGEAASCAATNPSC